MEYTGTIHKCDNCNHIWDYNETHCPECGSEEFYDININEEIEEMESEIFKLDNKLIRLRKIKTERSL